jgi:hypothetical protein
MVKEELGAPPEEVFAEWEREPFAAASIGQVHRAVTKGGDRVAVKVQYPGIDKAIENDLKSISLFESMMSPIAAQAEQRADARRDPQVFTRRARLRARGRDGGPLPPPQRPRSDDRTSRACTTRSPRAA